MNRRRLSDSTQAELHHARRDARARIERLERSLSNAQARLDALNEVIGDDPETTG